VTTKTRDIKIIPLEFEILNPQTYRQGKKNETRKHAEASRWGPPERLKDQLLRKDETASDWYMGKNLFCWNNFTEA